MLFALCLTLIVAPVAGMNEENLYLAEVLVKGRDIDTRDQAMATALGEVLVRVTGEGNAASRTEVQDMLKDPVRYVQQFHYREQLPNPEQGKPNGGEIALLLSVRFDAAAVDGALRKRGLPVWGQERPSMLVWLAVEDGTDRFLVGADEDQALRAPLEDAARRRGLTLLFPLLDLEDRSALSFSDVWGGFRENIVHASARYSTEALLIGRVYRSNSGGWIARWSLDQLDVRSEWARQGENLVEVLAGSVDGAAEALASRFAVRVGENVNTPLKLRVSGITRLEDYARVARYLASLSVVTNVQPSVVEASSITFVLEMRGDRRSLTESIALGGTLRPMANTVPSGEFDGATLRGGHDPPNPFTPLEYQLLP
jgi:Uncharacterized protein conserved in bacteria